MTINDYLVRDIVNSIRAQAATIPFDKGMVDLLFIPKCHEAVHDIGGVSDDCCVNFSFPIKEDPNFTRTVDFCVDDQTVGYVAYRIFKRYSGQFWYSKTGFIPFFEIHITVTGARRPENEACAFAAEQTIREAWGKEENYWSVARLESKII